MPELIREAIEQFKNKLSRKGVVVDRAAKDETIPEGFKRNVLTTENPVVVWDWYRWEPILEILLMDGVILPENKQLPLMDNHSRYSTSQVVGSSRQLRVENKELVANTRISRSPAVDHQRILVEDGDLTDTSIGYEVFDNRSTVIKPGEKAVIKGRTFENNYPEKFPLIIREEWRPFENSITPVGADQAAKFRGLFAPPPEENNESAAAPKPEQREQIEIDPKGNLEEQINKVKRSNLDIVIIKENSMGDTMTEEERKKLLADERARTKAILDVAQEEGVKRQLPGVDLMKEAAPFIEDEKRTFGEFQAHVFRLMKDKTPARTSDTQIDLTDKQVGDYSVRKIVLAQLTNDFKDVREEVEMSRALAKLQGIEESTSGILIPEQVQRRRRTANLKHLSENQRALIVGSDAAGGFTVHDQYIAESFIEMLTHNSIYLPDVEFITSLKGNIPMTRELSGSTFYWCAESSGPSLSSPTFGQETMSPKKGGAMVRMSYEWLRQTSLPAELYVERRLAEDCALGVDTAIGYGTGTTQPTGLKLVTGIGAEVGASFTRAKAISMLSQILDSGAGKLGAPKWKSNATVWATLKDREISEGTAKYLVDDNNKMIGNDFTDISGQVQNSDLWLGIWKKLIVGYWDQLEIKANESADSVFASGDVLIRALLALDTFCLRPTAFSLAEDVS
jgi:HK97 family phage major capsid protein